MPCFQLRSAVVVGLLALLVGSAFPAGQLLAGEEERDRSGDAAAERASRTVTGRLARFRTLDDDWRYALYDSQGRPSYVLMPAPQLQLEDFEGEHVRVSGFMRAQAQRKPYIFHAREISPIRGEAGRPPAGHRGGAEPVEEPVKEPEATLAAYEDTVPLEEYYSDPALMGDPALGNMGPPGMGGRPKKPSPYLENYPFWVRAEFLYLRPDGMQVPALVTTSPSVVPPSQAGVLGQPNTRILYGNGGLLDDYREGLRLSAGAWFDRERTWGVAGEYFELLLASETYSAASDIAGFPILARPFFNLNPRDPITNAMIPPPREDASLVAYPDVISGAINVTSESQLRSGDLHFVERVCCGDTPSIFGLHAAGKTGTDLFVGYRYTQLGESLVIQETSTSLEPNAPGEFNVLDSFTTNNTIHAIDFGFMWQRQLERFRVELLSKLAVGVNQQSVSIFGQTISTPAPTAPPLSFVGGLLAQRTNIGDYERNQFTVIPEVNARLGFFLTPNVQVLGGFTMMYLTSVVRPGDQIDIEINADLIPPENVPFQGPLRPAFTWRNTNYLVYGPTVSLEVRF